MRLAIAVPAQSQVDAGFANDLAHLYALTSKEVPAIMLNMVVGSFVHQARERLLEEVTQLWNATHVLWIDSDMRFPADSALRLIRRGVEMVAANYPTRVPPPRFVSRRDGKRVETEQNSYGLEQVDSVGFGLLLMDTRVLNGLPRPWFWYSTMTMTEDVYFCNLLKENGQAIYIDHDLSKEVGHVGQQIYRARHVEMQAV